MGRCVAALPQPRFAYQVRCWWDPDMARLGGYEGRNTVLKTISRLFAFDLRTVHKTDEGETVFHQEELTSTCRVESACHVSGF